MKHVPRFFDRWSIRGLLVFAIEVMALASLWLRDVLLAAMLQGLAVLVLSVHQLDRRLPSVFEPNDASRAARDDPSEQDGAAFDEPRQDSTPREVAQEHSPRAPMAAPE